MRTEPLHAARRKHRWDGGAESHLQTVWEDILCSWLRDDLIQNLNFVFEILMRTAGRMSLNLEAASDTATVNYS